MRSKYDWSSLKLEFFFSPHKEVTAFAQDKYGTNTAHFRRNTAGWAMEKKCWKQDMVRKALEEVQREEITLNKAAIRRITKSIRSEDYKALSMSDLYKCWKILRVMVGEPTSITVGPCVHYKVLDERGGNPDNLTPEESEAIDRAVRGITV